jgi:hypothetical protein
VSSAAPTARTLTLTSSTSAEVDHIDIRKAFRIFVRGKLKKINAGIETPIFLAKMMSILTLFE